MSVLLNRYYEIIKNKSYLSEGTNQKIISSFGLVTGLSIIGATNSYINTLAYTNQDKAIELINFINSEPMNAKFIYDKPDYDFSLIGDAYKNPNVRNLFAENSAYTADLLFGGTLYASKTFSGFSNILTTDTGGWELYARWTNCTGNAHFGSFFNGSPYYGFDFCIEDGEFHIQNSIASNFKTISTNYVFIKKASSSLYYSTDRIGWTKICSLRQINDTGLSTTSNNVGWGQRSEYTRYPADLTLIFFYNRQ